MMIETREPGVTILSVDSVDDREEVRVAAICALDRRDRVTALRRDAGGGRTCIVTARWLAGRVLLQRGGTVSKHDTATEAGGEIRTAFSRLMDWQS